MEEKLIRLIGERGPLTGSEIQACLDGDGLTLWRTCKLSSTLTIRPVGTRYLRLDRRVDGFARLSPSILREFLTYSVVGFSRDESALASRAAEILSHIEGVSRAKVDLAYRTVSALASRLDNEVPLLDQVCFIVAGDIVFNMAHDVPRPERSTGKMVHGSDMDLVVIVEDDVPESLITMLDNALYEDKCQLLMAPHLREEIDYIVKKMARVREQVRFDTFKHMVACKILQEGTLLYGSERLFHTVKTLLREAGVSEKLTSLEKKATRFRDQAEALLIREDPSKIREESLYFFYPTEESEEFE